MYDSDETMERNDTLNNAQLLVARLCISAVFLYSGVTKLLTWSSALSEFEGLGVPLPSVALVATILVQLSGGIALVLGRAIVPAVFLLAGFTVVATLIGHRFWMFEGESFRQQLTINLEHLAIVGGLLALAACSPNGWLRRFRWPKE